MKYAIRNVQNKVAGAQDRISVCRVGTSSTTISVYQTVVMYLGKSKMFTVSYELIMNILVVIYFSGYTRLVTRLVRHVIRNATVVVTVPVPSTVQHAAIFSTVFIVCLNVQ